MKKTAIFDKHKTLGAKLMPFGGFEMPVSYPDGINKECFAVRNNVGIFDVSHMGEFFVSGENAENFLQQLLTNDISKLKFGDAQYTAMCFEDGGIVDDLILFKRKTGFLLIVNASNIEKDFQWLDSQIIDNVILENRSDQYSLIAIQGPKSRELIESILKEKQHQKFYTFIEAEYSGEPVIISRTGYTGELGFEILGSHKAIVDLWNNSIDAGATPCGLAARDILRMEMKYCLYGNDMDEKTTPLEAGLGWITSFKKGGFTGMESIIDRKENGRNKKLIAFEMCERGIPRKDYEIFLDNEIVGRVTSGTQSPTLGAGIGLGYMSGENTNPGQEIAIAIRNNKAKAIIIQPPFIKETSLLT